MNCLESIGNQTENTLDSIIKTAQYGCSFGKVWLTVAVILYAYTAAVIYQLIIKFVTYYKDKGLQIIMTHVPPNNAAHKLRLLNGVLAGLSSPPDCGELGGPPLGEIDPILQETSGITAGPYNKETALLKGGTMGNTAALLVLTMIISGATKAIGAATISLVSLYLGKTGRDWYTTMIIFVGILVYGAIYDLASALYTFVNIQIVIHWCHVGETVLQVRLKTLASVYNKSSDTTIGQQIEHQKKILLDKIGTLHKKSSDVMASAAIGTSLYLIAALAGHGVSSVLGTMLGLAATTWLYSINQALQNSFTIYELKKTVNAYHDHILALAVVKTYCIRLYNGINMTQKQQDNIYVMAKSHIGTIRNTRMQATPESIIISWYTELGLQMNALQVLRGETKVKHMSIPKLIYKYSAKAAHEQVC